MAVRYPLPFPHGFDRIAAGRTLPFCDASWRTIRQTSLAPSIGRSRNMAFLELVKGSAAGSRFELDGDRSIIGRSADCEVPVDVPAVSRRHAAILHERGRYFIEDLQSRNGTILNDKRLTDRSPLDEGDLFVICDQEFRFHSGTGTGILDPMRNLEESSIAE